MEKKRVCVAGFGEEKVCWSRWRCFLPHDHGPAVSSLFLRERAVWRKRQLRNNEVSEVRRERRALFFFFSFFRSLPVSAFFQLVVSRVAQFLFRCFSSFGRFFFFYFIFRTKTKQTSKQQNNRKEDTVTSRKWFVFADCHCFIRKGAMKLSEVYDLGRGKGRGANDLLPFFFWFSLLKWPNGVLLSHRKRTDLFFSPTERLLLMHKCGGEQRR